MSSNQQPERGRGRSRGKPGRGGKNFHKPKREKSNVEQTENESTKEGKEELNESTTQQQEVPEKVVR